MKLLKFQSYNEYIRSQTLRNHNKIEMVAAAKRELNWIGKYLATENIKVKHGICHGVRNGFEVDYIRRVTGGDIIGTDISDTASQFANVIQWDFHDLKEEWIGKFDMIYSNSWDHAFNPDLMLDNWMKTLSLKGRCFLQWTQTHSEDGVSGADCFGLSLKELIDWIEKKYKVVKVHELFEYSFFDPKRYYINFVKKPRPGIRGRKIAVVVVSNK